MKPITLKFNGINCFTKPQEINFNSLGGVFGIFGATGSGKTTILDALSIALFGETARLGGKNYEFINNTIKEASVELTFICEKEYTVRRTYKQKTNGVDGNALLLQQNKTIAEGVRDVNAKICSILKMTAADYSKCIALPQNQFAAFLKSSAAERTALVGKLFGLEQYGENLIKSANTKKSLLEQQCQMAESQIESLGQNLQQEINDLQIAQQQAKAQIQFKTNTLQAQEQQLQIQNQQNQQFAKYNEIVKKLSVLTEKEPQILQNSSKLENHNYANQNKMQLVELQNQSQELQNLQAAQKAAQKEFDLASFDLATINRNIDEINKRAKTVAESDQIIIELKQLSEKEIEAKELQQLHEKIAQQIETYNAEIAKAKEAIEAETQSISSDKSRLSMLESKLESSKNNLAKIDKMGGQAGNEARKEVLKDVLAKLTSAFETFQSKNETLKDNISNSNHKIAELQGKINTILFELAINCNINEALEANEKALYKIESAQKQLNFIAEQNLIIENSYQQVAQQISQSEAEIQNLNSTLENLEKAKQQSETSIKKLSDERDENLLSCAESTVASQTEIGLPCPICGNTVSRIFAQQNPNATYYNNSIMLAKKEHEQLLAQIKSTEVKMANEKYQQIHLSGQIKILDQRKKSLNDLQNKVLIEFVNITENSLNQFNELFAKTKSDKKQLLSAKEKIDELNSNIKIHTELNEKNGVSFAKNSEIIDLIYENCEKIRKKIAENEFNGLENCEKIDINSTKESLKLEQDLLNKQILALSKEIEGHKSNILLLQQKITSIAEKISDCKAQQQEINTKISHYFSAFEQLCHGYASAAAKLEKVLAAKASIEAESADATSALKTATVNALEAQKNLDIAAHSMRLLGEQISKQKSALAAVFEHFGTTNIDTILQNILPNSIQIEAEIADYNRTKTLLEYELSQLEKPENISEINYTEQISATKAEISSLTQNLGKLAEQIKNKNAMLIRQNQLKEELEQNKILLSAATELCSLLRGKELLAFATDSYLQDITQKASAKLFSLLAGRYTITYENKEFYIIDNLSGATKRSSSTLSGGETFVVSLSLALAISETILAHSARPLEFFFLDEGFGTLDAELREVILSTLVKLHENGITIGLISHVEELKTEIKNRIVIDRSQDENGTLCSTIHFEQDI